MKISKNFMTLCGISGIAPEEINLLWKEMQEETIKDCLVWLLREVKLQNNQLRKLEEIFTKATQKKDDNLFLSVLVVLNREQKGQAIKKFSEIFLEKLESLYNKIDSRTTFEQKQVARAYLESINA